MKIEHVVFDYRVRFENIETITTTPRPQQRYCG